MGYPRLLGFPLPSRAGIIVPAVLLRIFVVWACATSAEQCDDPVGPIVRSDFFAVQGTTFAINQSASPYPTNISSAEIFFGVPYAEPPVGELRFEKPVPIGPYSSLLNCTTFLSMPACHQQRNTSGVAFPLSEDCLRMNIYRPAGTQAGANLPVLVYIHGGGYASGAAIVDSPPNNTAIPNFYVSQRLVFVQIQYRLALLGFASDGTRLLPGNYGLFDQQLALKWIHENIYVFGGDNSRITLWGISAGSSSIAYHSVNPHSAGYFQQVIQMSGSFNAPWAKPSNTTVESTFGVTAKAGCKDRSQLKACLKVANISAILAAQSYYPFTRADFAFMSFGPVYDNDFIYNDFKFMVAAAPPKRTLIGFSTDESIFMSTKMPGMAPYAPNNFTATDLADFIHAFVLPSSELNRQAVAQIDLVRSVLTYFYTYVDNQANTSQSLFHFVQWTRFLSDVMFIIPSLWEARLKAQCGWPIYLYNFDYAGNQGNYTTLPYPAVGHGLDHSYSLADMPSLAFGPDDYRVQKELVGIYTAFAIRHEVEPSWWPRLRIGGSHCDPHDSFNKFVSLNVKLGLEKEQGPSADVAMRFAFWDALSQLYALNLVHSFPDTQGQCLPPAARLAREESGRM